MRAVSLLMFILISISSGFGSERWSVRDSVLMIRGNVTDIPAYAFKDRSDFREIRFEAPVRLRTIGEYAFLGCSNLRIVKLPQGVSKLGEGCFRECVSLEIMSVPESVKTLPRSFCQWNGVLQTVVLPAGLEDIGSHAFAYCGKLREITIPRRVKHIGSNVFSFCESLREVKVPASVTELESYAFSECVSLERAELPANNSLLGELIFSGCRNLRELTVNSAIPPKFDCDSFIFEPDETALYERCRLLVPAGSLERYVSAPGWRFFKEITAIRR